MGAVQPLDNQSLQPIANYPINSWLGPGRKAGRRRATTDATRRQEYIFNDTFVIGALSFWMFQNNKPMQAASNLLFGREIENTHVQ